MGCLFLSVGYKAWFELSLSIFGLMNPGEVKMDFTICMKPGQTLF